MSKNSKKTVRLGDVATYVNGYAFKPSDWNTTGIPIIRIQDLTGSSCNPNYYQGEYNEKFLVDNEDVLISWSASLGVYVWDKGKALLNQHIFKVVFDKCEIEKYYYVFSVRQKLMDMVLRSRGATMKHIVKKDFENIRIPFPSKKMQKQIAGILMRVDSLLLMRKNQLLYLDRLVKSQFIEMFGDPVRNTMRWNVKCVSEVAPIEQYRGKHEKRVWLLNLDMVESHTGEIKEYIYVDVEEVGSSVCSFDEGNVLYSKLRPYLNKVVIPERKGYGTSEWVTFRPKSSCLNRVFFAYLIRDRGFVLWIREKVFGAKMPRVSMKDFMKFKCILPPIELQNKFADFVRQVDKSKLEVQQSLEELETLKKALMQEYFG
ncbi:restriction endonuclease subunit S [Filifactor villosus]|uniref:Restriction endonuclease subunit S n=1 Tax=Filifactor villosus TaxID=29374 RepID=A0ABV9QJ56_9FIRM